MSSRIVNFGWIRPDAVGGMAFPSADALLELHEAGIRAVLTLTERPLAPMDGMAQYHEPLIDFGTPDMALLDRCVLWIDEQRAQGRRVVVHCLAGMGRTGTVLAAWLIAQGHSAAEAIAEVRRLRPGSIETAGQMRALEQYESVRSAPSKDAE